MVTIGRDPDPLSPSGCPATGFFLSLSSSLQKPHRSSESEVGFVSCCGNSSFGVFWVFWVLLLVCFLVLSHIAKIRTEMANVPTESVVIILSLIITSSF